MEYLQKCFYKSTNWNEDNIFSNITSTSLALLEFPIPNGCKLDISSKATEHLASSFTLSNYHSINGSLAYLYSSSPLKNTRGTREISLQEAISGFKTIELNPSMVNSVQSPGYKYSSDSLLYGRMYFPGSALEAMIIKRLSQQTQLLIKCINNPHLNKNGTMIIYLQKNAPKFLREFIYSTNEALFGFRCLYNLGTLDTLNKSINNSPLIPKFDNSVISIGTEIWYAALSMSPGLSTAFRYSTRSTSTGKPLTMTLACNPILGHISSAYTVKTSVASTFCSRYDFNVFSYASNLSLGFEIYNYSNKKPKNPKSTETTPIRRNDYDINSNELTEDNSTIPIKYPTASINKNNSNEKQNLIVSPIQPLDNYYHINPILFPTNKEIDDNYSQLQNRKKDEHNNETAMTTFENLVNESDFSSVVKLSTSLNDKMVKLLWKGKCKDFLVSTGIKVSLNPITNSPEVNRFGVSLSYAC